MMYVSGETAEASAETTGMIEEIVRQQVIEMVCSASLQCLHEYHVQTQDEDVPSSMHGF
jgi:Transcription initiation factor IID, 18kD subunit